MLFYSVCCAQKNSNSCGMIIIRFTFFDTPTHKYVRAQGYMPDARAWYKDSLVVLESMGLAIEVDSASHQENRQPVTDHYTFINLTTRSFYEYASFSDTARIVQKYTKPDSIMGRAGWNFYAPRDIPVTEPPQNLPDTVIEGVIYQRVRFVNQRENKYNPVSIAYIRCDRKGTLFQIDKNFSEKRGCPIVRYEELPTQRNPFANAGEIVFAADTLSPEELKVFEAWERNAKQNPVK